MTPPRSSTGFGEERQRLRMRVAAVEDDGLPLAPGHLDLAAEDMLLHVTRREIAEGSRPFSPTDHARLVGQPLHFLEVGLGGRGGVVRCMPPRARFRVPVRQGHRGSIGLAIVPMVTMPAARRRGA